MTGRQSADAYRVHVVLDGLTSTLLRCLEERTHINIKAKVGEREVPLSVWAHKGEEERAAFAFGRTPQMVEFFSQLFGYDYAWDKYDQVVLRNFAGAMETTTMVGFEESHLKTPDDPVDDGPYYDKASPLWSYEDTISHELAHHWFGDLLTCRSLASKRPI